MASVPIILSTLTGSLGGAALDLLLPTSQSIGGIPVQTAIRQIHSSKLVKTRQPVEMGAEISDHSYLEPVSVELTCGWSNSSIEALQQFAANLINNGFAASDYVGGIYTRLAFLQASRALFSISTNLKTYDNMLVTSLEISRDERTSQALMVEMTCEETILVTTQTLTLPSQANQANPASTAEVQQSGHISPSIAIPPSGAFVPF